VTEDGRRYLFEYRHDGRWWGLQIAATDADDALARLRALAFAQYRGEVIANIPLPTAGLRNWANRLQAQFTRLLRRSAKG
jgi:hypothetical protein